MKKHIKANFRIEQMTCFREGCETIADLSIYKDSRTFYACAKHFKEYYLTPSDGKVFTSSSPLEGD